MDGKSIKIKVAHYPKSRLVPQFLEEIVQMADNYTPKPGKRGPYKRRGAA
jgi:hypothetical protein